MRAVEQGLLILVARKACELDGDQHLEGPGLVDRAVESSLFSPRNADDSVTSRHSLMPCSSVDLPALSSPITTVAASVIGMSIV